MPERKLFVKSPLTLQKAAGGRDDSKTLSQQPEAAMIIDPPHEM